MSYDKTKRRGPIAAEHNSPGPIYPPKNLVGAFEHDPRSSHLKGPAYSFGVRHGKWRDDSGPGPAYYPDPRINRTGRDGAPHFSLYGRPSDRRGYTVPGPGAYSPEHSGPTTARAQPAYSFGLRHRGRRTDDIPGPNHYSLPTQLGGGVDSTKNNAPIYSLTGRNHRGGFHEDLSKAPGPGAYKITSPDLYKYRGPVYSITARNQLPSDATRKPGPGAHSPEKYWVHKKASPAITMGIRHSPYIGVLTEVEN